MLKGEGAAIDAAKELGSFAKAVGKARIAFGRSAELDDRFRAALDDYLAPTLLPLSPTIDAAALDEWNRTGASQRTKFVDQFYTQPIRDLLKALRERVNGPI